MSLTLIQQLQQSLGQDLMRFMPELILCGGIVLLLLMRLFSAFNTVHLGWVALGVVLAALAVSIQQWLEDGINSRHANLFTGMLAYDGLAIFLRLFLFSVTALVIVLSLLTGIPDREDSADFNCLLLGATLGMSIMASANHLLMVFIGVEMASLPSYALAGFLKGKRQGSEASLKYVVYGGGAAGIMLYGISLLAGKFGTGFLPALATQYVAALPIAGMGIPLDPILGLGTLFILVGVAFKLAAVPFHFWCPDVFEGAAAEVAGFLSVASKGAALALLARIVFVFGGMDTTVGSLDSNWMGVAKILIPVLALLAGVTATFGNLAAYMQTNLKRLLAYSTIAHAGYMMMGLATMTREGASAVLFYLIVYMLMNLGAFAVVAFIRNQTGSEDLSGYRGLMRRSPILVVSLGFFLLSLLGIPPLAGFAAKYQIFSALYDAGRYYDGAGESGLSLTMYALLVVGGLNTVISAVYYIKVLKVVALEAPPESANGVPVSQLDVSGGSLAYAGILAFLLLAVFVSWGPLADLADQSVYRFRADPSEKVPVNQKNLKAVVSPGKENPS
ncbi:MAG TPA: NADH-quinone oxidoreductase subunit N [Gemmataceae bacterium]|nr:NADH-quinone oxidoreductase subunit N [Gemmataceae bacterium]